MDRDTIVKYATGEAHAIAAEAWFKFLGYVAATAVLHVAADKTELLAFVVMKWVSYGLLLRWTNFQIDQSIWAHFSGVDPRKGEVAPGWRLGLSIWVSSLAMFGVYMLVVQLIQYLSVSRAV